MKISSVSVSTPGHPGDVSRTTNFWLDRLAGDQGLNLCRPPRKPGSGRYTDGVTWEMAAQAGKQGGCERVTRGFEKMETGFFKSGDRLPQAWKRAAPM